MEDGKREMDYIKHKCFILNCCSEVLLASQRRLDRT